jgi:hypothetical protein
MQYTENCIPEEELPPRAGLLVIKANDPNHGLSEEEIQDRIEYIRCYLLKDFEVLLMMPKQSKSDEFFIEDFVPLDYQYSAFDTYDFQKTIKPLDKYGYAIRKIMERIQDLAIMHSSISNPVDRADVEKRYLNYLDYHLRDPLAVLIVRLNKSTLHDNKSQIKKKIAELVRRIIEAKRIWERYAPPDSWDR